MAERFSQLAEWAMNWKRSWKSSFPGIFVYYLRYHELMDKKSEFFCAMEEYRILPCAQSLPKCDVFPIKQTNKTGREVRDTAAVECLEGYEDKKLVRWICSCRITWDYIVTALLQFVNDELS